MSGSAAVVIGGEVGVGSPVWVSTVYELATTERLPHLRIGRAMRFSREDLETYLADVCRSVPGRRRAELA
jgi:excisionase family DNA binding protein